MEGGKKVWAFTMAIKSYGMSMIQKILFSVDSQEAEVYVRDSTQRLYSTALH